MIIKNYDDYDAIGLAELVARKEVTPTDLLETAIDRIDRYNPSLNAVTTKLYDMAAQTITAGLPQGPFTGVPFLLKDVGILYKGAVTTNGSRFCKDNVADHDSWLTESFKKAGLVIFGKTNTPEFGLSFTTESDLLGTCHNPWNLNLTPGGSSGGAAAAVATRITPIAHASDGGGSIRLPAACCGVFGLKPTRARVSAGPDMGEIWAGLVVSNAISISVRDSAAMLDAISGYKPGDPYCAPHQASPFLQEIATPPKPLKIALSMHTDLDVPIDPGCKLAVEQAAKLCSELGHQVEISHPTYNYQMMKYAQRIILTCNARLLLQLIADRLGKPLTSAEFEPITWAIAQAGEQYSATEYARALVIMHSQSRQIAGFFNQFDMLLTPTLAIPPVPIGTINGNGSNADEYFMQNELFSPFNSLFNMTGQPAMSVPLYWNEAGIPLGVQFVGRFGDEATLLKLAAQLEQAQPWKDKKPGLVSKS